MVFIISMFFLSCGLALTLEEQMVLDTVTGNVVVFFPEGGTAVLIGADARFELQNGRSCVCPAGEYRLNMNHLDYEYTSKIILVPAGGELIFLPELSLSDKYRQNQIRNLDAVRTSIVKKKKGFSTSAVIGWSLGLTCLAAVGGIEYLLANEKPILQSTFDRYRSASAEDAPSIWSEITDIQGRIDAYRLYEVIALGAASAFAASGTVVKAASPSSAQIDRQLQLLRESTLK